MEGLRSCMVSGNGEFVLTRCPDGGLGVTLSSGFTACMRKQLWKPAAGGFPRLLESCGTLQDLLACQRYLQQDGAAARR